MQKYFSGNFQEIFSKICPFFNLQVVSCRVCVCACVCKGSEKWMKSCFVAQSSLELASPLLLPPRRWSYYLLPYPAQVVIYHKKFEVLKTTQNIWPDQNFSKNLSYEVVINCEKTQCLLIKCTMGYNVSVRCTSLRTTLTLAQKKENRSEIVIKKNKPGVVVHTF